MSVISGENEKTIVRAIRGQDVVINEKIHHVQLSIAKAHNQNTDTEIISPDGTNKIECTDDNIILTSQKEVNIKSPATFSDNVNINNSIYLGEINSDSVEEVNSELIKKLKNLLSSDSSNTDSTSTDWEWSYLS